MNGDEFHVRINYGRNLVGTHMEVQTVYVDEGDRVTRGQEIGLGMSFDPDQSSAEFSLVDEGRIDGVSDGRGVYVSPFDYLDDTEKELLVEAYKEHVLDPYRADNRNGDAMLFYPYQPYLTNSLLIHNGNEGTITGEWLLREEWNEEAPNDLLTFIEADNEYYEGNIVLGMDDESEGTPAEHSINGTFTVDYDQGTLRISDESGKVYFARFSIDDSRPRAILTIQIQTGSYPASFTDEALEYVERDAIPRRMDGVALGVLENE